MKQTVITAYVFNAAAKTLDLSSISGFNVKRLYAVVNLTRSQVIYAAGIPPYGYVSLTGGGTILNLTFDTSTHANTDLLEIIYDTVNTDVANAFVTKVTDGVNTQAVKPASAAALAADPSAVVALSPNSPLPAGTNTIGTIHDLPTFTSTVATVSASIIGDVVFGPVDVSNAGSGWLVISSPLAGVGQNLQVKPQFSVDGVNWEDSFFSSEQSFGTTPLQQLVYIAFSGSNPLPPASYRIRPWGNFFRIVAVNISNGPISTTTELKLSTIATPDLMVATVSQIADGNGNVISAGQAPMSNSFPVVIASDQSPVPVANLPTTLDTNFGAAGASTIRTASLIGNAAGVAAFGAGTTGAQVLRVVLPTDQTSIPAAQSGAWTTGRTWTLASGTDSISAVQSGTWTVQQGTPPWSVVGNVASGSADSGNPVKIGGVFHTSFPTLTDGQRGDIQLDSSARQVIAPLTNSSIIKSQLQDNSGAAITLGQKTMASSLPVVIASDQTAFPVSQSGTWTVAQGTAAALSGKWPVQVTDGTNVMPTMDVAARAGFFKLTDGTNTAAVKPASTAAAAADPSGVVALSPNSPLSTGTNTIGATASESATGAAVPAKATQVAGSDGTNLRALATDTSGNLYENPAAVSFRNITTATTTTVKSGAGRLVAINVNTGVANATIAVFDSLTGTGTTIGKITMQGGGAAVQGVALDYKYLPFATGLTIVTSGATDVTVIYQ